MFSDISFEWDEVKNSRNKRVHGVSFQFAQFVFEDPYHLLLFDPFKDGEDGYHALGLVTESALILVVHTRREKDGNKVVRIISVRKATSTERKKYEERR